MTDEAIGVEAIYGAQSRRPLVALTAGPTVVRMTPAHAHRVARHLIGAAGAALADAAAVETLGGERLTSEEVGAILLRLRAARVAVDRREGTEED